MDQKVVCKCGAPAIRTSTLGMCKKCELAFDTENIQAPSELGMLSEVPDQTGTVVTETL
jgi:hypothetical protein